jgi:hypothetical protein
VCHTSGFPPPAPPNIRKLLVVSVHKQGFHPLPPELTGTGGGAKIKSQVYIYIYREREREKINQNSKDCYRERHVKIREEISGEYRSVKRDSGRRKFLLTLVTKNR